MTNEQRARKWMRDTGHSQFKEHVESLTELLDEVRADALREAAETAHQNMDHATRDDLDARVARWHSAVPTLCHGEPS